MKEKPKRNQHAYELFNKYSLDIIASLLLPLVKELGDPYTLKPCVSGVRGYSPKIMAVIVALCEYSNHGYRRTHSTLRGNPTLLAKLGLSSIPSKSTIGAAYKRIPKEYLDRLNDMLVEHIDVKSVAGDSTAMSNDRRLAWLSVRTADDKIKKGWLKIHTLIDIKTRVILKVEITKGTAGDAPAMTDILKRLESLRSKPDKGDATFDSAYLSRDFCTLLSDLGWTPIIKPKSNTTSNAKGSWAWKEMMQLYENDQDQFDGRYHQRSIVEAVYSAIKAMYGNSLRTRLVPTQTVEAMTHVILYNIEMVVRAQIDAGRLTEQDIQALVA